MMGFEQKLQRFLCITILCLFAAFAYAAYAADTEDVFWESVVKGNVQEEYELYLKQYPNGRYANEARQKIGAMREKARAQQEAKKQKQAEAAKRAEEEAKRREEAEAQRRRDEAEAERQRAEQEAERRRAEQEAQRREEEEAQRRRAEAEAERKAERQRAEQERKKRDKDAEWAQRLALLEKLRGQLTFSKALAILLDLNTEEELKRLHQLETLLKRDGYQSAYAMGIAKDGRLSRGRSWRWSSQMHATETALSYCKRQGDGDSCKVVMYNGDFQEKEFLEVAKRLSAQNFTTVRQAYLKFLENPR